MVGKDRAYKPGTSTKVLGGQSAKGLRTTLHLHKMKQMATTLLLNAEAEP